MTNDLYDSGHYVYSIIQHYAYSKSVFVTNVINAALLHIFLYKTRIKCIS